MKALFLVNRRSGVRRRSNITSLIRASCDWSFDIAECEEKEDLDWVIAQAAASNTDVVFAVGGDGTVHEVAKRLIGTPLALGIVPTGSGNGMARHLGIPIDVRRSLQACAGQRIVTIDTATVNGSRFVSTMGIGFDAWVAEQFALSRVRGLRTYAGVAARGFFRFSSEEYEMTIDGASQRFRAFVIAIANASQYGNNARIAPVASLQDGLLDVVVVERLSPFTVPAVVARLFAGTLHRSDAVRMMTGRAIEIRRRSPGPAHVDGEPLTLPEVLSVKIVPQSLRVLVPDRARTL